jgi:hypothetical protein
LVLKIRFLIKPPQMVLHKMKVDLKNIRIVIVVISGHMLGLDLEREELRVRAVSY